ncbi:unannotated protein [freshwater metagenome]|uniref:Unannotated protein n=1 Tax=freshwater metagenome TaxID=449393 RepID=A0A6J7J3P0_9ZZZZ
MPADLDQDVNRTVVQNYCKGAQGINDPEFLLFVDCLLNDVEDLCFAFTRCGQKTSRFCFGGSGGYGFGRNGMIVEVREHCPRQWRDEWTGSRPKRFFLKGILDHSQQSQGANRVEKVSVQLW